MAIYELKPTDERAGDVGRWWWDFINLIIAGYIYRDMIIRNVKETMS